MTLILEINQSNLNIKLRQKGLISKMGAKLTNKIMILEILNIYEPFQNGMNKLKEKAIEEYNQALKMPRKKKKIAKKSAIMLYNIACWGDNIF